MNSSSRVPAYSETDVVREGLLPDDWLDQINTVVARHATPAVLVGGTSTSLEAPGTNISYRLLDGTGIHAHLRWLDALYRGPLVAIASHAAGQQLIPSPSIQAGVNLNILDGPGGRYELHLDSNPLTGLLFVTGHDESSGGQLMFRVDDTEVLINPRPGLFITFDARRLPHAVKPLKNASVRISAPMNYYAADDVARPDDLDVYLYGQQDKTGGKREHI